MAEVKITREFIESRIVHAARVLREPVRLEKVRWRCPTCRRSFARRDRTVRHIDFGCVHDPQNQACCTCRHFDTGGPHEPPECGQGIYLVMPPMPRHCPKWERDG